MSTRFAPIVIGQPGHPPIDVLSPHQATHPRALTLRLCDCLTPELCNGRDGHSPSGERCRGHLAPTLEDDS